MAASSEQPVHIYADATMAETTTAAHAGAAALAVDVPVVLTMKFNGKVLAERTSLLISPFATWEAVARQRLEAVQGVDAESFLCTPLSVSLFRSADALPSDRVGAAISDPQADRPTRGGRQAQARARAWALVSSSKGMGEGSMLESDLM